MSMLVQLVSLTNIICQNMQQSNMTSYTGLLPRTCRGKDRSVELTYRQAEVMCFASLKTCPGFKVDHLSPPSLKSEISFNFDIDSAKGLTVNSSGFAVKGSYRGKKAVTLNWAILTNKPFVGLTPKYWAFEAVFNLHSPVNTYDRSTVLFAMAFASRISLYKISIYLPGVPGGYSIAIALSKGAIELSVYHSTEESYPKTIVPAPKTNTTVVKLEIGVVVNLARKRILLINVDKGEIITDFRDVDTAQPLWTMFGFSSLDSIRIAPKHILEKHLKTTLTKLQKSWKISHFDLLAPSLEPGQTSK